MLETMLDQDKHSVHISQDCHYYYQSHWLCRPDFSNSNVHLSHLGSLIKVHILTQCAWDSAFLTSSQVRGMLLVQAPALGSGGDRIWNLQTMPTSLLIQVSFASFAPCTNRNILLAVDATNSIHVILAKSPSKSSPALSALGWPAGVGGPPAPLAPSPRPRAAHLSHGMATVAQASRWLRTLSGARPVRPTQTLKGNRTRQSHRGRKGHLSFLCGISKEEAPRRLETKAGGEVNGEPGFNH